MRAEQSGHIMLLSYHHLQQEFASFTYAAACSRDASSNLNSPNVRAVHMQ